MSCEEKKNQKQTQLPAWSLTFTSHSAAVERQPCERGGGLSHRVGTPVIAAHRGATLALRRELQTAVALCVSAGLVGRGSGGAKQGSHSKKKKKLGRG